MPADGESPRASSHPSTHLSFRDPAGRLAVTGDRIVRAVTADGRADFEAFRASAAGERRLDAGDVIGTRVLDLAKPPHRELARDLFGTDPALLLDHDRVPFPSYPYEWPPDMLHAAAMLTLRLARELADADLGLKDATPFNVLFLGPRPVFVDVLSFERRDPSDPIWLAEAQCVNTFLLPLLLYRHHAVAPHRHFVTSRDGLSPEEVYNAASWIQRIAPVFLRWVSVPALLGGGGKNGRATRRSESPEKARFILRQLLGQLERSLRRLAPPVGQRSTWSQYESCTHYDATATAAKEAFVVRALAEISPDWVLDVGCNVGRFSRIAAGTGASVVALDLDPVVVGATWHLARAEHLDILPLVQNLAMPSPATGWRNRECPSFLERAEGRFEMVFLLAVVHHLLVTDRVPLAEVVDLTARLTTRAVVVEYVGPDDQMFHTIARGRDHLHTDLTPESFEIAWGTRFRLLASEEVPGTSRRLYLFAKP